MECRLIIFAGVVAIASSITISPNGNSPERTMVNGGMMIDAQKGMNPTTEVQNKVTDLTNYEKSRKVNLNTTNLSLNERYRRLIPYMTFYYANDIGSPSTEPYSTNNVEIQKAQIQENTIEMRNSKKINYPPYRQVPRYQVNRPTKYNIASANPTSTIQSPYPNYSVATKVAPNHNQLYLEQAFMRGHTFGRFPVKHSNGQGPTLSPQYQARKPYQNLFNTDDSASIQYYVPEKEPSLKYRLVPYEQTSPVQVAQTPAQNYHHYDRSKKPIPVPVLSPYNNNVYANNIPRTVPVSYENALAQPPSSRLQNYPATEMYYEQNTPETAVAYGINGKFPAAESGFRPMVPTSPSGIEPVSFIQSTTAAPPHRIEQIASLQSLQTAAPEPEYTPSDYEHVAPIQYESNKYSSRDSATLSEILATLQRSNSIPQPITKDNVGTSIRTLLQVLSTLKASAHTNQYNDLEGPVLSTPKPFQATPKIIEVENAVPVPSDTTDMVDVSEKEYLAPVNPPSQHLDHDYRGSSQAFPLNIASEDDGGTPGRAGVDYPTLTVIPPTSFDCKTQRYKGFFADPDTRCQVWHYCDLNGGQASFLCPNGTIFSQAALTCDWWFNVRCDSTAQLYVLNERLYKYILPHSPKFPEDYSGPLVDKYLTIKFKEMEEQFRKNKEKQSGASESTESEADVGAADSTEQTEANSRVETEAETREVTEADRRVGMEADEAGNIAVSEASVVVESPGNSGTVQHLED